MKQIATLLFFLLLHLSLDAITLDEKSSNIDVLANSSILYDETNSLFFEDIKKMKFQKSSLSIINLGIAPDTALWIRFTLQNSTDKVLYKTLEYANPETEEIDFFSDNQHIKDGMFHHRKNRRAINPAFEIELQPYEEKLIYIKAHCKISTMIAKLTLWNNVDFIHQNFEHKLFVFLFFSVIATLFLYNLMLYIFTKDMAYFYYIAYLFSMMFFQSVYLGVAQLYFFNNEVSIFITKGTIGYISLLVIPIILFTMEFLNTQQFKKLHKFLKSFLYILPIITILSFNNFLFDLHIMLVFFPLAFMLIFTGIYAYISGVEEAKFYLVGWSALIISLALSVYQSIGGTLNYKYMNELAFMFEAFMFSIALAHKIKIITRAKHLADEKLIAFQRGEQELLQNLVNAKTKELRSSLEEKEILYKELNHRVKNNLQMILSLIELQINKASGSDTKEELRVTKNRISSIAELYEILHLKEELQNFQTLSYFSSIVKTIQKNFTQKVEIKYDIQHNVTLNHAIYSGLILNELVTNSFKYAFKISGIINISTYIKDGVSYMVVKDNGVGFNTNNSSSLGLIIVETLTKKQLQGNLIIESQNGVCVTISWSENEKS